MTEYKFTPLQQLKMSESGSGTIEGYRATWAIDEGGDLLIKGAFEDTMEEFLNLGFTAHSHVWTFSEAVGFPLTAKEDGRGWFVKSQFHSTDTAQDVRTIARERMKAGKQVGFSFGYSARDYDYIDARDYDRQIPRFSSTETLEYNLVQAKRFPRVRILKKVDVIEDSIVTAPMNKLAAATGVKYVRSGRLYAPAGSAETEALRERSYRLRASAIKALYGLGDDKGKEKIPYPEQTRSVSDLRLQSERLRNEVRRTLLRARTGI